MQYWHLCESRRNRLRRVNGGVFLWLFTNSCGVRIGKAMPREAMPAQREAGDDGEEAEEEAEEEEVEV